MTLPNFNHAVIVTVMPTIQFPLSTDYIEVNQLLKLVGICDSGGAGKAMVAQGLVSVDGQAESRKTAKIRAGQMVACGDLRIDVVADEAD